MHLRSLAKMMISRAVPCGLDAHSQWEYMRRFMMLTPIGICRYHWNAHSQGENIGHFFMLTFVRCISHIAFLNHDIHIVPNISLLSDAWTFCSSSFGRLFQHSSIWKIWLGTTYSSVFIRFFISKALVSRWSHYTSKMNPVPNHLSILSLMAC